ncbi:Gvp36p [Ascoidea rubescens DSM 1968]|uniref:Putative Golgi vesicle protein n=1 Tax=Ascoidea rubescens DSM 1968 TaxID=1344418 RepID=A0A1D2VI57_9ASCO|nr:putative Golgi vesicle protein [Ascoidea rubescens DSM 1968]ODV61332.1 putative Golgi vesicle protein [Ascoidea rubescens DSM 1968]
MNNSPFSFDSISRSIQGIGTQVQGFGSQVIPSVKRTQRLIEEKLGNVNDVSQLPQDYVDLEKKIDSIKLIYNKLLNITMIYENENYDYPPNLKENFIDLSNNVVEKVRDLSKVTSVQEMESVLIGGNSNQNKAPPKTLNHALGRAAITGSQDLQKNTSANNSTFNLSLIDALNKFGSTELKIGEARLTQDNLIRSRFNLPMQKTLKTSLKNCQRARILVEQKRLSYDSARSSLKNCKNPAKEQSLRSQMETLEDEFASATEDAVSIMKSVIENSQPLNELIELVNAQLIYHQQATNLLSSLLPEIKNLNEISIKNKSSAFGPDDDDDNLNI